MTKLKKLIGYAAYYVLWWPITKLIDWIGDENGRA